MDPLVIILFTIIGVVVLRLIIALVLCGGDVGRLWLAVRGSLRMLRDADFSGKVQNLLEPPAPSGPPPPSGEAVRLVAVLQREGRLLDFLLEDIGSYANEQIGAAVRDIHRQCRQALQEHVILEPILDKKEGDQVEIPAGFDPSAIRLTGNVTGQPPFRGTLQHHGWRVKELKLAAPAKGQNELVLQAAEVELP